MRQLKIAKNITPHNFQSLGKYFNEIDKIELLKPDEEADLARKVRNGDQSAIDRLTVSNLRFVVSVAKQYQTGGIPLEDLINEGNIGLMIAATRYDESKGFRFVSYAVWWIRQSITMAIAEHARFVRLPYNKLILIGKMNKAISILEQDLNRKPSLEELSDILGVSISQLIVLIKANGNKISLDEPNAIDVNVTLHDVLPHGNSTDRQLLTEAMKLEIQQAMLILPRREREIVTSYFGLNNCQPLTLEEIAIKIGCTKEHAGRIKQNALEKIRNCSRASLLRACLGD